MSEAKHTPEPWRVGKCGASMGVVVADTPVPEIGGSDAVDYYGGHLIGESITPANAARIVACVNACAGMGNPEQEIAALSWSPYTEWISVDDLLPEEGQRILFVVDPTDTEYAGRIMSGTFRTYELGTEHALPCFSFPGRGTYATHWMPLPHLPDEAPPKWSESCPHCGATPYLRESATDPSGKATSRAVCARCKQ